MKSYYSLPPCLLASVLRQRRSAWIASTFLLFVAAAPASAAITGTIHNGTTNSPGANVDVVLIALQNDMQTVANTKSDTQGHFSLNYTPAGNTPMLIRAIYKGVNFHSMLPPGQSTANVEVYEPEMSADGIQYSGRLIVFQPQGTTLLIGEEYDIQNQSSPPKAYFKLDGDFSFSIPAGAQLNDVSAAGPERMPTTQGTMPRGTGQYAIAYPFRPGENMVRLSYQLPYVDNRATLRISVPYAVARTVILAHPALTLTADGFQAAGSEQGMTVYTRDNIPAGSDFNVTLSGAVPPGSDAQDQSAQGSANGRETGAPISTVPPRIDQLKWILLAGFGTFFILGAIYLWRKPAPAAAVAASISHESAQGRESRRSRQSSELNLSSAQIQASAVHQHAADSAPGANAPQSNGAIATLADFDRGVSTSLDELKDMLFKLELRHQAGTIPEADYAAQRARAEKILRDLVRG
ncbi:MAG TPA: carboxypeptidase-like regulatory domain-containing protein [Candidatus Acidoferrales bacterium]|nr:carboxypeptidase-like regulatory domain-containing protein [Candidatus Acidoferrales bacterium]